MLCWCLQEAKAVFCAVLQHSAFVWCAVCICVVCGMQAATLQSGCVHASCRYSQHTANCAQCQAALKQIRTARRVLTWVAGVAASLALLTAAAAAAVAAGSGAAASAAASTQGSGLMGKLAQGVTGLLVSVCGLGGTEVVLSQAAVAASDAAVPLGRLALWAGAAGVACLVQQQLGHVEGKLLHGDYPPPRNTDRT